MDDNDGVHHGMVRCWNGSADCSDTTIAKLHEFFDHTGIAGANGAAHLMTRDAPKSERADSVRH